MNRIIFDDCINAIQDIDNKSIDLLITSPPYNVNLGKNKHNDIGYNEHDDNMDHDDYILWLTKIFFLLKPKMKDDGRLIINIGDGKNGSIPTHAHIINFMLDLGYSMYTTIIWDKNNTSSRTAWGSWKSPSCPSFPTPFEYILVFYNKSKKKLIKGETDLKKKEFIDNSLAIWEFPGVKKKHTKHPAAFPLELPYRCIKQFTWIGDRVLDIFAGSGTTGQAAKLLNRKYTLIEKDPKYFSIIEENLNQLTINDF